LKGYWEGIESLGDEARLNAAAGMVMLTAGLAAQDGVRMKKAVDYFECVVAPGQLKGLTQII
jgi:hypothetical protein